MRVPFTDGSDAPDELAHRTQETDPIGSRLHIRTSRQNDERGFRSYLGLLRSRTSGPPAAPAARPGALGRTVENGGFRRDPRHFGRRPARRGPSRPRPGSRGARSAGSSGRRRRASPRPWRSSSTRPSFSGLGSNGPGGRTPLRAPGRPGRRRRFGELRTRRQSVSPKVLTQSLRRLEDHSLVHREVCAEVPPRVEYSLTDLGTDACVPLAHLRGWVDRNTDRFPQDPARPPAPDMTKGALPEGGRPTRKHPRAVGHQGLEP
ncbi:winged helix-turn-helix transcriptional regulator [Kitasatospora sp. NPDC094028]